MDSIRTALRLAAIAPSLMLALMLAPLTGGAQEMPAPPPLPPLASVPADATDISGEDWARMVRGRTVTYAIEGAFWAQEMYNPVGNIVSIRLNDGTCMEGLWTHSEGQFCFAWDNGELSCFRHLEQPAGPILIVPVNNGAQIGTMQTVLGISDIPLVCGPALSS